MHDMTGRAGGRSSFHLYLALAFMAIAITGFSTTFFLPLARGTFVAPPVIYLHGSLVFGWLSLFIAQVLLIRSRNIALHRRLGWLGAGLCIGIVISGVAVGHFATLRDVAAGGGDFARGQFVNILIEMALFGGLVTAAIVRRRDRESHVRLLVLANTPFSVLPG